MVTITDLRTGKKNEKRIHVHLDGRFAFSLDAEVAEREGLQTGQELPESRLQTLARSDQYQRALNAAFRYLGYRPRSEAEIREKLLKRDFVPEVVDEVIGRLRELGMVDDIAFARFWVENRESFRPRSRRLTGLELRRMGVGREVVEQVVEETDDAGNAYRAAVQKTRQWPVVDYHDFRRRLGDYLRRRGFDYEVINHVVGKVWQEKSSGEGETGSYGSAGCLPSPHSEK
jgi:regulatory protein